MSGTGKPPTAKQQADRRKRRQFKKQTVGQLQRGGLWDKGATVVPTLVLRLDCLSPGAKCCYGVLLSFAWGQKGSCFPGLARLANDIGCTEKTAGGYVEELVEAGLVLKRRRGLKLTNFYDLPGSTIGKPHVRLPSRKKSGSVKTTDQEQAESTVPDRAESTDEAIQGVKHSKKQSARSGEDRIEEPARIEEPVAADRFAENLRALEAAGISNPKRAALAGMDHVTPEYVRGHLKAWQAECEAMKYGGRRVTRGLLVTRIAAGDPVPPEERDGGYGITFVD